VFLGKVKIMTDNQIEKLIWKELNKRGVTLYDMIGGDYIDPDPDDKTTFASERMRPNRFTEMFGEHRMKELLCIEKYDPYNDMPPLKISFHDLFRFWWNRCIEKELFVDEVLRDIFDYFADRMKPESQEPETMKVKIDFDRLDLFPADHSKAA